MLRNPRYALLIGLACVLLAAASLGQKGPKVKYDPATEVKVGGIIEEVQEFECPASGTMGFHISLKTGDGLVTVHVAASKFMKDYEINFEKGQHIDVVGSKVKLPNGDDGVLAREIQRGQSTYAFRDKQGNPLW